MPIVIPYHYDVHPHPVFGCDGCIARAEQRPEEDRDAERLSRRDRDRARTQRHQENLAKGIHPATLRPLAGNGETCRSCAFFERHLKGKTFFKCAHESGPGVTAGSATDIRATWPACELWKAAS